jgi:hypothetical protein
MTLPMLQICDTLDNKLRPVIAKLVATKDFSFEALYSVDSDEDEQKYAVAALTGLERLIIELQDSFDDVYEKAGNFLKEERKKKV